MDIKEFANVNSLYRDRITGKEVKWREYMGRIINKLGIENIRLYIPYSIRVLKECLNEGDVHFNNTNLERWNNAGGFKQIFNARTKTIEYLQMSSGLINLLHRNGITCYSPSDTVCILKEAARILCEEVNKNETLG